MICVENLKKVYISKRGKPCTALDGVSFVLPERGMVFVVGKSGSGKSTLLKLLGGLDSPTEGDVVVLGKRFSDFTEGDYDGYRSDFVGFVFQDFCLIDKLTVFENVALSLDICARPSADEVDAALRAVDLFDYAQRLPKELSGGQQQRVALARAIVKKPRLILADEPTGNLDQRTAKQILDSLKELSRDRLVVIVSHNADDAEKYADRIIELSDGKILRDVTRIDDERPLIDGTTINLPTKRRLTNEEISLLNAAIKTGEAEISQSPDDFEKTVQPTPSERDEYRTEKKKITKKSALRLFGVLSRGGKIHASFTVLLVSIILILLSLCRVFAAFDGEGLIKDSLEKGEEYSFTLFKGYRTGAENTELKTDKLVEVTDGDIAALYEAGYEGKIYKLYNVSLGINHHDWNTLELGDQISFSDLNSPYINLAGGVLECDKSFLDGLYGKNGEIEVIGDINEATPRALIITDYFADCIIQRIPTIKTYEDVLNEHAIGYTMFDVKAIVKTGYAERYAELLNEFERISGMRDDRDDALERLKRRDDFNSFVDEVQDYLSLGYYFGNDYEAREMGYHQSRRGTSFDNVFVTVNGEKIQGKQWGYYPNKELKAGEIKLSIHVYNEIMGTEYSAEEFMSYFEPFKITLSEYPYYSAKGNAVYEKEFTVVGISYSVEFCYAEYLELYEVHTFPYALYFDNAASAATLFMNTEGGDFFLGDEYYKTIYKIMDIVSVFEDFFLLLYVGLIAIATLLLVSYARRSIKRRIYEIGVLRALGCKNSSTVCIFTFNMVIVSLIVSLISIVGVRIMDPFLNTALIENLSILFNTHLIKNLTILRFDVLSGVVDILTILLLSFLSALGILRSCRKIKPMQIIQSKE